MDVELKFFVDEIQFSIDVRKKFLESLKDIYKALSEISRLQQRNEEARANAGRTLDAISSMYRMNTAGSEDAIVKQYNALLDNFNDTVLDRFGGRDYSAVFENTFTHRAQPSAPLLLVSLLVAENSVLRALSKSAERLLRR